LNEVYVIMFESEITEGVFYTDEIKVSEIVEQLRESFSDKYWYKTLQKA